ncbi:hypothetical protein V5O48_016989 [Marasmius crinis-equi]|uniref:Uncharacterized protein n=1 Tax=Marasmius crinis-equi TaxID=585013 RepID=A0ABR3EQ76_9AGAR
MRSSKFTTLRDVKWMWLCQSAACCPLLVVAGFDNDCDYNKSDHATNLNNRFFIQTLIMKQEHQSGIAISQPLTRKRKLSTEHELQSAKRPHREASLKAATQIKTKYVGSGAYFDSQTTDSQYFDFPESQQTGLSAFYEEESQVHYGNEDDDWYLQESQAVPTDSALPEEDGIKTDIKLEPTAPSNLLPAPAVKTDITQSTVTTLDEATHLLLVGQTMASTPSVSSSRMSQYLESSVPKMSQSFTKTPRQQTLEQLLSFKYPEQPRLLVLELLKKAENSMGIEGTWACLDDEIGPPRAIKELSRAAGITREEYTSNYNTLRHGHLSVAAMLVRIGNELMTHGGQLEHADRVERLRTVVRDGRLMMETASLLLDIEDECGKFVDTR